MRALSEECQFDQSVSQVIYHFAAPKPSAQYWHSGLDYYQLYYLEHFYEHAL